MAIHAAMVDRMDREIGRVLAQLRLMGEVDHTVVFFMSDNGADATLLIRGDGHDPSAPPGCAASYLCPGPGWATASNAPFRRHKIWVNEGGISTPLIVNWPEGLRARNGLRHDLGHVIDIVPTVMELAGEPVHSQPQTAGAPPLPGLSLVPAILRETPVNRDFLFFHHEGNRALRMGDWKLVSASETEDVWELFDLRTDRGERTNLAATHPDRVRVMADRWQELQNTFSRQAATD